MNKSPEKSPFLLWSTDPDDESFAQLRSRLQDSGRPLVQLSDPMECLAAVKKGSGKALYVHSARNTEKWRLDTLVHAIHAADQLFPVLLVYRDLDPVLLHSLYRNGLFDALKCDTMNSEWSASQNAVEQFLKNRDEFPPESLDLYHTQGFGPLTGNSEPMQKLYALLVKVLNRDLTISIFGDSGTGKEIVARFLHHYSRRSDKRFVTLNCAAVPESLLESELFGHEKGAFTGANSERIGKFEYAHEGSLFLDEIGEMSLPLQAKLLRIIETAQFERVGANESRKVNVRLITATNRDLEKEVEEGQFRRDLLFRISVFPLLLAPLKERHHDAILLSHRFIDRNSYGELTGISREIEEFLSRNQWDGNIRELENTLTRFLVMGQGPVLSMESEQLQQLGMSQAADLLQTSGDGEERMPAQMERISEMEKWLIDKVMKRTAGNISEAARRLGISRVALYRKLAADDTTASTETSS